MGTDRTSRLRRWRWPIGILAFLVLAEIFLRTYYGFCDAVLLREDPHYEYIAEPSQDRWRFRHHIRYNSLSMRSEEPDSAAVVLLGCGDSVINGGVLTDQDSLATTLLSDRLSETFKRKVQVLNISAGSWGPDNCTAYLEHTTVPTAKAIVLFVSSHDAHDNMSFKKVVGVKAGFPKEQYRSAIVELVDRYLLPKIWKRNTGLDSDLGIDKHEEAFNPGFTGMKEYAETRGIPFVIFLHAEASEIRSGVYNAQGQEIIRFAREYGIPLVMDLDHGVGTDLLRDKIHPDEGGQRKMAEILFRDIMQRPEQYGLAGPQE
ncbi:MAG TPA: hypothetical protein PLB89_07515 [Flavobacteriales bacterium]|nr:hypothetical protein [Flavobacteriales bacterium]